MPTKDRLKEFKKFPVGCDNDKSQPSDTNVNCVALEDEQQIQHHVIGSGGRLADFFDKVEKISMAIDSLKKNIDEVKDKQGEILKSTENRKLQEQVNDRQTEIKNIVNSKIRIKVAFSVSLYHSTSYYLSFYFC